MPPIVPSQSHRVSCPRIARCATMGDPYFTQEVLMCFEVSQRPSAFVTFELQQQERIREARRRQHRARFRGIVRSTVQLRRAARRASPAAPALRLGRGFIHNAILTSTTLDERLLSVRAAAPGAGGRCSGTSSDRGTASTDSRASSLRGRGDSEDS